MSTHLPVFTRGTTPYWTYPCGCQASALALTPCPLHAAAPRMLAALRGYMEFVAGEMRGDPDDDAQLQAIYADLSAILRDVEGP